jgi:hypothetical protein
MSGADYLPAKPFVWKTQDGQQMSVNEMRTTHLFYVVRMIWNHTMPKAYRLPGGNYNGPQHWSAQYRHAAVYAMLAELKTRTDLPVSLDVQLGMMRDYAWRIMKNKLEAVRGCLRENPETGNHNER